MSIQQVNFPTTIRFGAGAIKEVPTYLSRDGLTRPLIVSDSVVTTLPFFTAFLDDLKRNGFHATVFSDIHKNPVSLDVYKGGDAFEQSKSDSIIGMGGGAALDVSRAIALRINHREDIFTYDDLEGGDRFIVNDVPPFFTIPTTAGTGSEVGRSAIIAEDASKRKRILFSPKLMAKIVFADPVLTMELPPAITAATGMDALTHNMEAFLAKGFNPMCDGIALEGMRLIATSLDAAVNKPDIVSRSNMLMASMMGAVAFQKGLGVVHSLAHPLSSLLDTHHGLANAVNLPYGMEFNIHGSEEKFRRMARAMNLPKENGSGVVEFIHDLNQRIGIPSQLKDIGVTEEHLETLSDLAWADFCHPNNPRPVTKADFLALYQKALSNR